MPKKILKTYHGLPKTPIDDNTLFYASFDGTITPEVGAIVDSSTTTLFKPSITGLGATKSASGANRYKFTSTIPSLSDSATALTIDCMLYNTGSKSSAQQFIWILNNTDGSFGGGFLLNLRISEYNKFVVTSYDNSGANPTNCTDPDPVPLGLVHVRVIVKGGNFYLYVNGKFKTNKTSPSWRIDIVPKYLFTMSDETGARWLDSTLNTLCSLSITNGDLGYNFPTLPQDFIDGNARVSPKPTTQRSTFSDVLTSEYKSEVVKIGNNSPQITNSRTSGSWTSGDTVKVKGMGGEVISGVIDSDTALARVMLTSDTSSGTPKVLPLDDVSKLTVGDTIQIQQSSNGSWTLTGTPFTITAIDTTNKTITFTDGVGYVFYASATYYVFESTTSSSSPTVKYLPIATATGGSATTIVLTGNFSSTDDYYNGCDIEIIDGTGKGQRRYISDYTGSSRTATVSYSFSPAPDTTSVFKLYSRTNVAGTWSNLGTNEATFTLGSNASLISQDIQIEYSLNEIQGQGSISEVLTKTIGGEVGKTKLTAGTTITIRDDFANKNGSSLVENPNIFKSYWATSLANPLVNGTEYTGEYSKVATLNGTCSAANDSTSVGRISQHLFSFNLIRMVEDKFGEIPSIDKVAWLRTNITKLILNWYGYGLSNTGYKCNFNRWSMSSQQWIISNGHNMNTPTLISGLPGTPSDCVDNNGFVYMLAYAEPCGIKNILTENQSSVETDTTGFTTYGNATVTRDTNYYQFGSACLKVITDSSTPNQGFMTSSYATVYPSNTYTYSVYLKGSGTVKLQARCRDSGNTLISGGAFQSNVITLTDTFTRYTLTFTTVANTSKVDVNVITDVAQTTTFYSDGLQLELGGISDWSIANATGSLLSSSIFTDYISVDMQLTVPTGYDALSPDNVRRDSSFAITSSDMTVTDDFNGKIQGDTTKVPHICKTYNTGTSLKAPTDGLFVELVDTGRYNSIASFDGTTRNDTTNLTSGQIPQQLYSFNLVRAIEDQYGTIPVADKISWVKNNINSAVCTWIGYGTCSTGNKAYFTVWNSTSSAYSSSGTNTSSYPTSMTYTLDNNSIYQRTDTNGFLHFIIYSDASDGVTASTVYTDYISISLTLKDTALTQLPLLKKKCGKENLVLVRRENKEVQFMFKSNDNDYLVTYGDYVPTIYSAPANAVFNILAKDDKVTAISNGTGKVYSTSYISPYKNALNRLAILSPSYNYYGNSELLDSRLDWYTVALYSQYSASGYSGIDRINANGTNYYHSGLQITAPIPTTLYGKQCYLYPVLVKNSNGAVGMVVLTSDTGMFDNVDNASRAYLNYIPIPNKPLVK